MHWYLVQVLFIKHSSLVYLTSKYIYYYLSLKTDLLCIVKHDNENKSKAFQQNPLLKKNISSKVIFISQIFWKMVGC